MQLERIKNYALSLFEVALEKDQLKSFYLQLEFLYRVFSDDYLVLLSNLLLPLAERKKMLAAILEHDFCQEIINFLCLLLDKNIIRYFNEIYREFTKLTNAHYKVLTGVVYTIELLSEEMIKKIEVLLAKKLASNVKLTNKIKKDIIGGIVVIIDDKIFDYSYANKLLKIRQDLLIN